MAEEGNKNIEIARKALMEYIAALRQLKDEQRKLLISVLRRMDQEQINELKNHLAEL